MKFLVNLNITWKHRNDIFLFSKLKKNKIWMDRTFRDYNLSFLNIVLTHYHAQNGSITIEVLLNLSCPLENTGNSLEESEM